MKKLLLLLPIALLMTVWTSCDKPDKDEELAKEIIGTYDYHRYGSIYLINIANNDTTRTPHDSKGKAEISHLGGNRIQLNMGGAIFTARTSYPHKELVFDTYSESFSSDLLNISFKIDMTGVAYAGRRGIGITESYSGTSYGPNTTYATSGHGWIELNR